jgi:hypothetical protein
LRYLGEIGEALTTEPVDPSPPLAKGMGVNVSIDNIHQKGGDHDENAFDNEVRPFR